MPVSIALTDDVWIPDHNITYLTCYRNRLVVCKVKASIEVSISVFNNKISSTTCNRCVKHISTTMIEIKVTVATPDDNFSSTTNSQWASTYDFDTYRICTKTFNAHAEVSSRTKCLIWPDVSSISTLDVWSSDGSSKTVCMRRFI